jgi:predicted phosphodiesterase
LLFPMLFFYQACSEPKATVFEDNRLAQEEQVRVCLLGDLGRGTSHQQAMVEALEREECHRIFFLGDLVYPRGIKSLNDPELEERFLKYYLPLVEKNPHLIVNIILGNHDHKEDPAAWKDVSKLYPQFFFPHYYYLIDYGGLCFVAMDTSFYYYTKLVKEMVEQTNWLNKMQSRIKKCDVKIAVSHHPLKGGGLPGSKGWKGASGPLKVFLKTYVIGKMDMHIAGHVHILRDEGKDEGTRLLISGTGGENLGEEKPGFVVLNWSPLNPKAVSYYFRRLDTDVNVFQDEVQSREEQEFIPEDEDNEYIIEGTKLEKRSWLFRIFNFN